MAIGMLFLHERLSFLQWLGTAVIFTGLVLNRLTQPSLTPAAE